MALPFALSRRQAMPHCSPGLQVSGCDPISTDILLPTYCSNANLFSIHAVF